MLGFTRYRQLPARALMYTLLISLLIALVSATLIKLSYTQGLLHENDWNRERLIRNVESGMQLILAAPKNESFKLNFDLYNKGNDSIFISKTPWGVFDLAKSTAIVHQGTYVDSLHKTALLAYTLPKAFDAALNLAQGNVPLGLCGKTRIVGTAYLPRVGVKRVYVNGKSYQGDRLIYGNKKQNNGQLPSLDKHRLEQILELFKLLANSDQLANPSNIPFSKQAVVIRQPNLYLDNIKLSGQLILVADSSIYFGAGCMTEDIIAIAPEIHFAEGFRGQLQAFAKKKLNVAANCQLDYPSVLGLIYEPKKEDKVTATIEIQGGSSVEGLVFLNAKGYAYRKPLITIGDSSWIQGVLHTNGRLDLKGTVYGSVSCERFSLKTASALYENYLLDATIDRSRLSQYYLSTALFSVVNTKTQILKCLD
ncbi:MAG: hypothetical protein MK212_17540 [Saprospiraceae bacterium]|nr:hypothetical protein [Saprospiraceae bacterium]